MLAVTAAADSARAACYSCQLRCASAVRCGCSGFAARSERACQLPCFRRAEVVKIAVASAVG